MSRKKTIGRYVDPCSDFGFRWYFGREENKEFLIAFLNGLFAGQKVIRDLSYAPTEQDGDHEEDPRVVFDLNCIGADGEHFIVEMQRVHQTYFKDRALFYTSRLINRQVRKGRSKTKYLLPEVYFIGVLEFRLDLANRDQYFYDVALCDRESGVVFYKKLGYKFLVLPNFQKTEAELESDMDLWLYFLKTASEAGQIPTILDNRIFRRIFDLGEIAKLTKEDQMSYEQSLKRKWDWESALSTARRDGELEGIQIGIEQGRKEGREEGLERGLEQGLEQGRVAERRILAAKLKEMGVSVQEIKNLTGLSDEEITVL